MFLVTPNPTKQNIEPNDIFVCEETNAIQNAIHTCAKSSSSNTACVWELKQEHIGKYKEFRLEGFQYTNKGEVLPL